MAYSLIWGGNTVAGGGAQCSSGGGGGYMGWPQRGPAARPAGHSLACTSLLACPALHLYSLTAGKGTRENLFLVPIQPFRPLLTKDRVVSLL